MLPLAFEERESTGAYKEKHGVAKIEDLVAFVPGLSVIGAVERMDSNILPQREMSAYFRAVHPELDFEYKRAARGKKSSIRFDEGATPTVDFSTAIKYFGMERNVPPVFDVEVRRGEYAAFREFLPGFAERRTINRVDIFYFAEGEIARPEKALTFHASTTDISRQDHVKVGSRIYRRAPKDLLNFVEGRFNAFVKDFNLYQINSASAAGRRIYGQRRD